MTGFSTRCWRRSTRLAAAPLGLERVVVRWLLGWLLAASAVLAQAQNAEIAELRLERTEEGVLLSAQVQIELSPVVDDALHKGIPMFFVAEASLLRERWYWYDKLVVEAERHMRLSYQPLTRRWRLQTAPHPIGNTGLALGQTFDTLDEALAAMRRISRWNIAEPGVLESGANYSVDFRFRLDVSQLARPFQIGAVGQSDWNISAGVTQRMAVEGLR